jgi:type III restriction enzyme
MPPTRTPLRVFQQEAVSSAVAVIGRGLTFLRDVQGKPNATANQAAIKAEFGSLLFEAPTGCGKTLMACETVDQVSRTHDIVWLWFAPFSGVVGQTIDVIRDEYPSLSPHNLADDRHGEGLVSGAIYTTTWAAVASRSQDRRARSQTEQQLSVDDLVRTARDRGFRIGTVIDEAHHSFRSDTQAFAFFREVLDPDVTILVTATPRDRDIDLYVRERGVTRMNRIAVSRAQGVEARLLKRGVRAGTFTTGFKERDQLLDFESSALIAGIQTHNAIKRTLAATGVDLTPLMLVQVDSTRNSTDAAKTRLLALGVPERAIRVHTADEPDPDLRRISSDPSVEVLIFKLAVATGFDVPRAFTLVSLRSIRDADFGVQIVGRLMRLPRELQNLPAIPDSLNFGYVFLAQEDSQDGLLNAAQRINSIRNELASVSDTVFVAVIGDEEVTVQSDPSGQPSMFPVSSAPAESPPLSAPPPTASTPDSLLDLFGFSVGDGDAPRAPSQSRMAASAHAYPLRTDLQFPRRFLTVRSSPDEQQVLATLVTRLAIDDELIALSRKSTLLATLQQREVFDGRVVSVEEVLADLTDSQLHETAQYNLQLADRAGALNPVEVLRAIQTALADAYRARGLPEALDASACRAGVSRILTFEAKRFKRAFREAINEHLVVEEADPLEDSLRSAAPLPASRLNVYGVYPADLNDWERSFAELLERDARAEVLWWHRNPVRKPWSIAIPLAGFDNFYPDFVVGVRLRTHIRDGVLLVETKERATDMESLAEAKTRARHPAYGRTVMLYLDGTRWRVVDYDDARDRNVLLGDFDISAAAREA